MEFVICFRDKMYSYEIEKNAGENVITASIYDRQGC